MDIRTKLVFTLMAASLGSMFAFGAITYSNAQRLLTTRATNQLERLADAKKERVDGLLSDWKDRVRLAASPAPLKLDLRDYNRTPVRGAAERIRNVLADAAEAVSAFESVAVYDRGGRLVASAGASAAPDSLSGVPGATPDPVFLGTRLSGGELYVAFALPLVMDGEPQGLLRLSIDGAGLVNVSQDRGGLGETGETLIVGRDESGEARLLAPPLNAPSAVWQAVGPGDPAMRALEGEEGAFVEGQVDYRGETVWAVTRHLSETGWGLVVKVDAAEERVPIAQFRRELIDLGTALSAFAILLGIVVGLRLANPIHDLAEVATRIRDGELEARASVSREDEIGLFARTFNDMAEELERRMTLLREYKKFFDLSLDMLCIAGTDGYFKRLNPAFERTLGWSTGELVNQPFNAFIHPDDVEATDREVEKLTRGIPTISFENRYRCADGRYKHLRWTSHPEPETGMLYAVAREVTPKRRGGATMEEPTT